MWEESGRIWERGKPFFKKREKKKGIEKLVLIIIVNLVMSLAYTVYPTRQWYVFNFY